MNKNLILNEIVARIIFYCPETENQVEASTMDLGADIDSDGSLNNIHVYCTDCKKYHNFNIFNPK